MGRYRPSATLNPRENRLTESFAAVLERVDGLAQALVGEWLGLDVSPATRLSVATQKLTASGGFVDLELRIRDEDGGSIICWIEIKHGAPLHGPQLQTYLNDIQKTPAPAGSARRVALLAPRQSMPSEVPRGVSRHKWQDVARLVRDFQPDAIDPVDQWLIAEFHRYLEEEELADGDAFETSHAMWLTVQPDAERVLEQLHTLTDEMIAAAWAPRLERSSDIAAVSFWSLYPLQRKGSKPRARWPDGAYLEWNLEEDPRSESEGQNVYVAGVTFGTKSKAPHKHGPTDAWQSRLATKRLEYLDDGGWYRACAFLRPEVLLLERDLEAQARSLSNWILGVFSDVLSVPPSRPAKGS